MTVGGLIDQLKSFDPALPVGCTVFHAIRSVIEAHSRSSSIQKPEEGTANGIAFERNPQQVPMTVRVTTASGRASYKIDRWD